MIVSIPGHRVPTVERRPQDLPGLQGDPQLHRRRLGHLRGTGQLGHRNRHPEKSDEPGRLVVKKLSYQNLNFK